MVQGDGPNPADAALPHPTLLPMEATGDARVSAGDGELLPDTAAPSRALPAGSEGFSYVNGGADVADLSLEDTQGDLAALNVEDTQGDLGRGLVPGAVPQGGEGDGLDSETDSDDEDRPVRDVGVALVGVRQGAELADDAGPQDGADSSDLSDDTDFDDDDIDGGVDESSMYEID